VIWNFDVDTQETYDRAKHRFNLAQSLTKNQAKRQSGLDRQIGINRPTAALAGDRRTPRRDGSRVNHTVRLPVEPGQRHNRASSSPGILP
jgi:hypothetical protein